MFNLGTKFAVLNRVTSENVYNGTSDGKVTAVVAGYNTFIKEQIVSLDSQVSIDKVSEVSTWDLPASMINGNYFEVEIVMQKRKTDRRKKVVFTTEDITIASIIEGYDKYLQIYNIYNPILTIEATGTGIKTTISTWEPDVYVHRVYIRPSVVDVRKRSYSLPKVVAVEGNSGLLYGTQIEESIMLGTSGPFSESSSGSSNGVILGGRYKVYFLTYDTRRDKMHEFTNHHAVNAGNSSKYYRYTMYVLDYKDNISHFEDVFSLVPTNIFNSIFGDTFN